MQTLDEIQKYWFKCLVMEQIFSSLLPNWNCNCACTTQKIHNQFILLAVWGWCQSYLGLPSFLLHESKNPEQRLVLGCNPTFHLHLETNHSSLAEWFTTNVLFNLRHALINQYNFTLCSSPPPQIYNQQLHVTTIISHNWQCQDIFLQWWYC